MEAESEAINGRNNRVCSGYEREEAVMWLFHCGSW